MTREATLMDKVLAEKEGVYIITSDGTVEDYAARWAYGYIVAVRPMSTRDVRHGMKFRVQTNERGIREFDVITHMDSLSEARGIAKFFGQAAIYDLRDEKVVKV